LDISEGKFSMKAVIRRAAASVRTAMMLVSILTLTLTLALAPARAADDEVIVVFAAASLKNALDEVNAAWMRETGTAGAAISYAGSSALARQIEQGAPADIFISADLDWMDYLAERDLISQDSRVELLGNRLVLVAATGSDVALSIAPGFDLAGAVGEERLAMADTQAVPAGRYGRAALETLGVWDTVAAKIAQSESGRRCSSFLGAKRLSASSTGRTQPPTRAWRSWILFRRTAIRRSSIPQPSRAAPKATPRLPISLSCDHRRPAQYSNSRVSPCSPVPYRTRHGMVATQR
jgi:molybdenum ABC transporter molybdate-binding protein